MIPEHWRLSNLGAIAVTPDGLVDGPFGSNLPASDYTASGIPVIRGSNLSLGESRFRDREFVFVSEATARRLARSLCVAEDLIFTKKGTLGQTGFIPAEHQYQRFLLSSNQMRLRVDRAQAEPLFVYYFVSSPSSRDKVVRDAESTGVPKTNLVYLRQFPIALPPLGEQRAIAHILNILDEKIELNRKSADTLEQLGRAVFRSWFLDFDPVRAKAAGRVPCGMDAETAALFPSGLAPSELGEVPHGWSAVALSEVAQINRSYPLRKGALAPYVEMSSLPTQGHRPSEWPLRAAGSGARFKNGDTLFARITPCLENGKTAFVDFLAPDQTAWGSTEYIVITPDAPLPPEWGYLLAREPDFREAAIRKMEGSTGRQRVPASAVASYRVIRPSTPVAEAFGRIVAGWFAQIKAADEQSRTLAQIRDALLPPPPLR